MDNKKIAIAVGKGILIALGITGIMIIAVVAPNVFSAFGSVYKPLKKSNSRQIKRSLKILENNNSVSISQEGDRTVIRLTKNGEKKLLKYKIDDMKIEPQKKWDKKWRLVIFDVPEKFSVARTTFRRKICELGFIPLQKSVWAYPYPCEDQIDFLKEVYEIRPFVRVVTAESIDIQNDLLKRFKL